MTILPLSITCPECYAELGNTCIEYKKGRDTARFRPRKSVHLGRVRAAQARDRRDKRRRAGHNVDHDAAQLRTLIRESILELHDLRTQLGVYDIIHKLNDAQELT